MKTDKKLSCRKETAQRFVSLNIFLSHSKSLETTMLTKSVLFVDVFTIELFDEFCV